MKYLIVVDMQNDFTTGSLGSAHAAAIIPNVVGKVKAFSGKVIFTRDTHGDNYLQTQEGRKLPVSHCIKDTDGWQICEELAPYADCIVDKVTFGSVELPYLLQAFGDPIEEIELCGLCTDICVMANAVLLRTAMPDIPITVTASCCAGSTPEAHENALKAMKSLQIDVEEYSEFYK